jgi:hypothetical protein
MVSRFDGFHFCCYVAKPSMRTAQGSDREGMQLSHAEMTDN